MGKSTDISKLLHLETVDFSHCEALNGADLSGQTSSDVAIEACNTDIVPEEASSLLPDKFITKVGFINCFKFNQEVLFQQLFVCFKFMILLGEEVPSYFPYRTTETSSSLTVPLLETSITQHFFRFRACAVVAFDSLPRTGLNGLNIHVNCRFKDECGNIFDSSERHSFRTLKKDSRLFIFDCCIPLNKDNALLVQPKYNHVDVEIKISSWQWDSTFRLKGWGVRLYDGVYDPKSLPHVCEADEEDMVSDDGCHKMKQGEECGGSDVETERSKKSPEVCIKHETEHHEDCGDSTEERRGSRKRMRATMGRLLFKKLLNRYAAKAQDT
ncbi:unnamed protein product [Thlaspi arvense]|uniref:C-JID domain-containing protein n=1 Tax=Thlaspi arvense TaxID=13288 RepID=A0AAU9SL68_THLAR|nr:unnamed protein product [Thlaspi arvense]